MRLTPPASNKQVRITIEEVTIEPYADGRAATTISNTRKLTVWEATSAEVLIVVQRALEAAENKEKSDGH